MNATATLSDLQTNQAAGLPATAPMQTRDVAVMPGFNSQNSWELANRIGKAFAASSLVPQHYQNNIANCIVALEMANRMGASPLMVMQNLYIVHGNPGWSSKFLIACFNQCGRFSAIRYEFDGPPAKRTGCRAWAIEKATGEKLVGATITMDMAKEEGWSTKAGSKWKTMPEQMLMYRAAAFFVRTYAPEISMGLQSDDELQDLVDIPASSVRNISEMQVVDAPPPPAIKDDAPKSTYANVLAAMLKAKTVEAIDEAVLAVAFVEDAGQQVELRQKYDALRADLVATA